MSKWLAFIKRPRAKGKKTDYYDVSNIQTGIEIGVIYWYGGFRKYVFAPNENTIFDGGCLKEISEFVAALMEERKLITLIK